MAKVGIVTDTTNCLPIEFIRQYGIGVIPVSLYFLLMAPRQGQSSQM